MFLCWDFVRRLKMFRLNTFVHFQTHLFTFQTYFLNFSNTYVLFSNICVCIRYSHLFLNICVYFQTYMFTYQTKSFEDYKQMCLCMSVLIYIQTFLSDFKHICSFLTHKCLFSKIMFWPFKHRPKGTYSTCFSSGVRSAGSRRANFVRID